MVHIKEKFGNERYVPNSLSYSTLHLKQFSLQWLSTMFMLPVFRLPLFYWSDASASITI